MHVIGDVLSVFNANTALVRVGTLNPAAFNLIQHNTRVLRLGLRVGF